MKEKIHKTINVDDKIKVVLTKGKQNYKDIFESLERTDHLYVTTFNYSMPQDLNDLLNQDIEFINDVRIIFNVFHYDGKEKEKVHQLLARALQKNPYVQFFYSSDNHSKIISSGKKMYIGSSNLTDQSANNFEAGVIINDSEVVDEVEKTVFGYPYIKYQAIFTDPIAPLFLPLQLMVSNVQNELDLLRTLIDSAKGYNILLRDYESVTHKNYEEYQEFLCKFIEAFKLAKMELQKCSAGKDEGFKIGMLLDEIDKKLKSLSEYRFGKSTVNFFDFIEDYRNTLEEYKDHYWRIQTFEADVVLLEEELYVARLKALLDMFFHLRKTWIEVFGVKTHAFLDNQIPVSFWYTEPSMAKSYWRYFLK
ncbi:hypothetical protein KQ941_01810 [Paenibacillus xylanexedens]|uniref:phospholipase D-like domain-containing protein n=1 Tax=Paenibacillus xylanexedens TaxID=528191 RepID=UPI001F37577E|nr:phospholipase D-like domain-containing protein [Paenibacillus xylanexedens]MCF7753161.1 hypothetical protein [Paenibacillus xylanexedens]